MKKCVPSLLLVLVSSSALAAPMTLDDIAKLRAISEAKVSPDGQHVAFVQDVPRKPFEDEDGSAWSELNVVTGDRAPRRFVRGEVDVSQISWSADGRGIFFLAKRDPKPASGDHLNALYAIPVDGGEAFEVCQLEADIASYSLHPDGSQVALLSTPPKSEDSKTLAEKGFKANVVEEDIRDRVLYVGAIDEDGACEAEPIEVEGSVVSADWSPDGDRLLLAVAPTSLIDDRYMQTGLRVIDREGSTLVSIDNVGKVGGAAWSPDGRNIAYLGVDDIHDPAEGRLKVADAGTGEIRDLLPGLEGHVGEVVWQDADSVLALVDRGVETVVWAVDLDGGEPAVVTGEGDIIIRAIDRASDADRLVAIADAATYPREVFDLGESAARLTDSNPWLTDADLARQTVVTWTAQDGLELQGLLVWPLDYTEGERYPLVIFVHGGPEAHRRDGWLNNYSTPTQVFAGKGYFSFVPNYRGSTGRGVEFSKLGQNAYAKPEFDDIVDGKNHLIAEGLVDGDRVGITGGSYGGFATAWSATALTEHYAAGVMFVGISNQISKFGTTDIPNEMNLVHARAWPWEDWQWFLERSPIYYSEQSKTPLLIMHGDADPRVHPAQSLEMYRYLKTVGQAPVRLVLYPGEGHGNRKAAARYDYSQRLVRWMDHYLTGDGGEPPPYEIDYSAFLEDDEDEE